MCARVSGCVCACVCVRVRACVCVRAPLSEDGGEAITEGGRHDVANSQSGRGGFGAPASRCRARRGAARRPTPWRRAFRPPGRAPNTRRVIISGYCRVTWAQQVVLLGARVEQLRVRAVLVRQWLQARAYAPRSLSSLAAEVRRPCAGGMAPAPLVQVVLISDAAGTNSPFTPVPPLELPVQPGATLLQDVNALAVSGHFCAAKICTFSGLVS